MRMDLACLNKIKIHTKLNSPPPTVFIYLFLY